MSNQFIYKHYQQLLGKTVKSILIDDPRWPRGRQLRRGMFKSDAEANDPMLQYGLEFTDGTVAWIMKDVEGNGAGWLDINTPPTPGRKEMEEALELLVAQRAKKEGWPNARFKRELKKALRDVDWLLEVNRRIVHKKN